MNQPPVQPVCRVAIVDDHTLMREGIRLFVNSLDGFECVWQAASCREAIGQIEQDLPDLMIVDITLPDRTGLELIKDLAVSHPEVALLVLSMHDEKLYALRALKAGAKGYVMKHAPHQDLEASLRKVAAGGIAVSSVISDMVVGAFSGSGKGRPDQEIHTLTDREFEIFQEIGKGLSTNDIATALKISPKTVDVHRLNIRTKLRLEDGGALTRWAIRWMEASRQEQP
ncbi:MAG: response regulator transcription factor [Verrucomicrobiales bacterium]